MSRKIIGVTVGTPLPKSNLEQTNPKMGDYVKGRESVVKRIEDIEGQLADLLYKPITISSFTAKDAASGKNTLELGTVVTEVSFAWAFSKQPKTVTFNGKEMPVDSTGYKLTVTVTNTKNWNLVVTDERDTKVQKSAGLTFLNGVYHGVCTDGATTEEIMAGLTKELRSDFKKTFTATAGAGQRHAFAIPSRYGTPTFKDAEAGFQAGFYLADTFLFTNSSGYSEEYTLWLSTNIGLGSMTVAVS